MICDTAKRLPSGGLFVFHTIDQTHSLPAAQAFLYFGRKF